MQSNECTCASIRVELRDSQNAFSNLSLITIRGYGGRIQRVSMLHIHKAWLAQQMSLAGKEAAASEST